MQSSSLKIIKPQAQSLLLQNVTDLKTLNQIKPQQFTYSVDPNYTESPEIQQTLKQIELQSKNQSNQQIQESGEGDHEVLLIRHGTSIFNIVSEDFKVKTGYTFKDKEAFFNLDLNLMDTQLHYIGQKQAECLGQQLSSNKIHTVFVSPLKRTLETCYHTFKNHPQRKNIKFVVFPLISEIYSKICDIGFSQQTFQDEKLRSFFDFSLIDELWQVDNIQDEELKNKIIQKLEFENNGACKNLQEVMLDQVESHFPKNVESYDSIYKRGVQTKNFIKNYIQQNNIDCKNNKIVIVSHNSYLRNFTAREPDNGKTNSGGMKFANCQAVNYKF